MVFNANFNNNSAILWQSVLLVEETIILMYPEKTTELLQVNGTFQIIKFFSNIYRRYQHSSHHLILKGAANLKQQQIMSTISVNWSKRAFYFQFGFFCRWGGVLLAKWKILIFKSAIIRMTLQ
jgi:hypothetical protein